MGARDKLGRMPIIAVAIIAMVSGWHCQRDSQEDKSRPAPRRLRPAAVAGAWYPADAAQLRRELDGYFAAAGNPAVDEKLRALIVPHAGYRFSGRGAAAGYARVRGRSFARVVVIAPSHRGGFTGLSIADVTHYQTPLGDIALDLAAVAELRKDALVHASPTAHDGEHSIEMQLPMLQQALAPGWKLVPVLVSDLDRAGYAAAAELLRSLADDQTLIVASGDFTHYGEGFDYRPFPADGEVATRLRELDLGAVAHLVGHDPGGFADYRLATGITACAFAPASILANLAGDSSAVEVVSYYTSADVTGDRRSSVSYVTVTVSDARALAYAELRRGQLELLHELACRALAVEVGGEPGPVLTPKLARRVAAEPRLGHKRGAFVTLEKQAQLRGCIGHIEAAMPLYRAVIDNAVSAAVRDRRFAPVTAAELAGLEVEVSVLSPLRAIASADEFEVGSHGIILAKSGRRAVYLPEVAPEQGWDRAETLSHLARKAGLSADAWQRGASFKVFTSQKYGAPYR